MKKTLIVIGIVLCVLVLACFGGGTYMVNYALTPDYASETRDSVRMIEVMTERSPQIASWLDSILNPAVLRDTVIVSPLKNDHGAKLKAHYVPAALPTDKTVTLVHGYNDSWMKILDLAYMYHHDLGFNVFIPDQYGHGWSEGESIRMGWLDRFTIMNWMDIANDVFGGETQMVVHGVSMGAATTMMISGENVPEYVKCFVEDCGYTSVWDEFAGELKNQFGLPEFPILHAASIVCDIRYGWNFKEASAIKQVAKCELPMLFIHGDSDDFVPTWMVYPLYEAKQGVKDIFITEGVPHARSYTFYPAEYTDKVREFTGKYIL